MAGKIFSDIYCSRITVDRLSMYLASTDKGALRVGLVLDASSHPTVFFRHLFQTVRLKENDRLNRPLAEAVEATLLNRPLASPIPLDVSFTRFQERVLEAVATIPLGQTRTYKAVAAMVQRPLAARAVGQVMGRNPFPLIFP